MVTRKAGRRSPFVKQFRLDQDNSIHVEYSDGSQPKKPGRQFASEEKWAHIASEFLVSRLVAIWNGLPGVDPGRRFTSREIAASRIWKALQKLEPRQRRKASKPVSPVTPQGPETNSRNQEARITKTFQLIELLQQGEVSLGQLSQITGWQKHSVRGFISGILRKKMGLEVISSKNENGTRVYRIQG